MDRLATLKFDNGSLEAGYTVILQIGEAQSRPTVEMIGHLPPAPSLQSAYQRWQTSYRRLGGAFRLEARTTGFATNVSCIDDCRKLSQILSQKFNQWLAAESFRPLQEKLLERLNPQDTIRLIVQTQDLALQQLPWSAWKFCDRYPKAEIALSAPTFEQVDRRSPQHPAVRVLAILGHSEGIDVATDQRLLNHLPNAHIEVLEQPSRQSLNNRLWEPLGWDILFFAGHSITQRDPEAMTGKLFINPDESLTIPVLKLALKKSLERGLQIAIFNSCDGLGLAQALADLQIPQVLVMREPVPDRIAHEFLKAFLEAFARGESLYLAVREAREKLQGFENQFPCATWLPTLFQNPAEPPPTWSDFTVSPSPAIAPPPRATPRQRQLGALLTTVAVTALTLGFQQLGWLQNWEVSAFDRLLHWQPSARPDPRFLIVTVTEADVQAQPSEDRRGSLTDQTLSELLQVLEPMAPRLISLDIYRDFYVLDDQPKLQQQMSEMPNLYAICKGSVDGEEGIAPPPELSPEHIGFSDFSSDWDNVVRRQLLLMSPEPNSPCQAVYAFGTLLALRYLEVEGVASQESVDGFLQLGDVVFQPLDRNFGGYQGLNSGGHQIMLNYRPLPSAEHIAESVTLADALNGKLSAESVRDRIVLIGAASRSFPDYWQTPYPGATAAEREVAGVFMQAHMVSHLLSAVLDNRPLIKAWPLGMELLWIATWAGLGGLLAYWNTSAPASSSSSFKYLLSILAAESTLLALSWLLLIQLGYWVPLIPAALALGGSAFTTTTVLNRKTQASS